MLEQIQSKIALNDIIPVSYTHLDVYKRQPDLSILVQLAEYYDVEMRELLDGERSQTMNKDMKETLDKVAVDVYKRQLCRSNRRCAGDDQRF